MTGWHVDDDALRRWIDRTDSLSDGASVEQHLLSCDRCRATVNATVTAGPVAGLVDLSTVWSRTRDAIELPRPSAFERLLRRAGLPEHEARLVAVASAFRGAWLTGVAVVLAFAAVAGALGHSRGAVVFLLVAPLVPCLMVASSYDPEVDPALEPELVTPYPALRLILLRTITVLAVALPAEVLAGLLIPGQARYLWLLPALGFTATVLALSTWTSPLRAAVAVSLAWLAAVWLLMARSGSPDAALRDWFQLGYLLLAAASLAIFLIRRGHLRELRPRRS